jgi:hypothetical protein
MFGLADQPVSSDEARSKTDKQAKQLDFVIP